MEEWTRKSNRGTGTARVTYVIRNPHRPPPGRERPCSDHNRPTRSRSDQHVRTVTRCLGVLGGQRSGAADAYGHASGSRETGRHPALRPPSTVSRPVLQGRADDFECESVLCSSQRRAESNRAVVRVTVRSRTARYHKPRAEKQKVTRPDADPVATPSRAPCCFPVARHETEREFRRRCRTRRCAATEHATRERVPR